MAAQEHVHPESKTKIYGEHLKPGTMLQAGDVYDSTDGKWRLCDVSPGSTVPHANNVIFVRPVPT